MAKVWVDASGGQIVCCPGCGEAHYLRGWQFNGDLEKPTFNPSLLARTTNKEGQVTKVCHSFVADGKIRFLADSTHKYAGQTLDLLDIPEFWYR